MAVVADALHGRMVSRLRAGDKRPAALIPGTSRGYGLWCIGPLDHTGMIGVVGFHESSWEPGGCELLYSLDPAWWGKQIATEGAEAAVDWAFATLGWARIAAATDTPNVASAHGLERIGMRLVREGTLENGLPTVFYELSRVIPSVSEG